MNVGVMSVPVRRLDGDTRPLADLYRDSLDRVAEVEQLGYDFFMAGEHHFFEDQWNPSPLMLLASAAARTSTLRLSTNVLLAPMYHPVRLAEDVATLDLLSNGRFSVCCGAGSVRGEFETLGINADERTGRLWEVMDILRRAFSETQFDYSGKYYQYPNVRMTTRPAQEPYPIYYGGTGSRNAARAGCEGYHAFLHQQVDPEVYIQGLRSAGHDPSQFNIGVCFVTCIVVSSQAEVDAARERAVVAGRAQVAEYARTRDLTRAGNQPEQRKPHIDPEGAIGTPDQVLRLLEPRLKASPYTHITTTGAGSNEALFVKEVMPVLRQWGRDPVTPT